MQSISAEMSKAVHAFSNDLKVMKEERKKSPSYNTSTDKWEVGSGNLTKEKEVRTQDFLNNSGSEKMEIKEDIPNQDKPEQMKEVSNSNCESQISCLKKQESSKGMVIVKEAIQKDNAFEPLDPRLMEKSKDNQTCNQFFDHGSSVSLIMEVEEIEDDTLCIEGRRGQEDDQPDSVYLDDWDRHRFVAMSPDLEDTLLIDIDGIPYTLSPDGHKVPQTDTSKILKINQEQTVSLPGTFKFDSRFLDNRDADSRCLNADQEVFLPNLSSSSSLSETVDMKSSTDKDVQTTLPSLSSFSSLPVQIGASNTDLGANLLDFKSEHVSCTTTTCFSGQTNSCNIAFSPTSPTSASPFFNLANQLKTENCLDAPTSFQEALIRLAVSAKQKKQPKCNDKSLVLNLSSCTEATQVEGEHHSADGSLDLEQTFMTLKKTDSLLQPLIPNDQSSNSPVHSELALLPENQDSQALGPRRILYCQYCPRIFYFLSDLERHSITHSQKKPHVCQWCDKAFKRSSHLQRHKHIHTGERNFQCQLCPRRFREAAELLRHQRVHTGEKPYQCLLCHMRFSERNTLRRHTKRKHQGQHHEAINKKRKTKTVQITELQEEDNAEWYSSAMPEMESDNDTEGE